MKKNIKIIFTQIIFLFFTVYGFCQNQTYDDIFFYANSLYEAQAFEQAEVEYKRYIFMQDYSDKNGEYEVQAFCRLAELYEKKEQWTFSAQAIQKAINSLQQKSDSQYSDELLDTLRLLHIRYLYKAAEKTKQFLSEDLFIFSYMNIPDFNLQVRQCAYCAAISNAVINGRIEYAEQTFNKALELFPQGWDEEQKQTMIQSFEKLSSFKPKNQKLAAYLSFIPGLGQLYAANYKDSLNAFLLNGSIIAVSVWSICTLDLWTFSLLEFDPLIRFMKGNIYNAQKDVYEYNLKKQSELAEPICEIMHF